MALAQAARVFCERRSCPPCACRLGFSSTSQRSSMELSIISMIVYARSVDNAQEGYSLGSAVADALRERLLSGPQTGSDGPLRLLRRQRPVDESWLHGLQAVLVALFLSAARFRMNNAVGGSATRPDQQQNVF